MSSTSLHWVPAGPATELQEYYGDKGEQTLFHILVILCKYISMEKATVPTVNEQRNLVNKQRIRVNYGIHILPTFTHDEESNRYQAG
jgi:hypothetical protein